MYQSFQFFKVFEEFQHQQMTKNKLKRSWILGHTMYCLVVYCTFFALF